MQNSLKMLINKIQGGNKKILKKLKNQFINFILKCEVLRYYFEKSIFTK
jgi:hypothetical protein